MTNSRHEKNKSDIPMPDEQAETLFQLVERAYNFKRLEEHKVVGRLFNANSPWETKFKEQFPDVYEWFNGKIRERAAAILRFDNEIIAENRIFILSSIYKQALSNDNYWEMIYKGVVEHTYQHLPADVKEGMQAIREGDISRAIALTTNPQQITRTDAFHESMLSLASTSGASELLDRFYKIAFDQYRAQAGEPESRMIDGMSLLEWAIKCDQPREVLEQLVAEGFDVNAERPYPYLFIAIDENSETAIQFCLDNKAEMDVADDEGFFPLNRAALDDKVQAAETLLRYGADVNDVDSNGELALSSALYHKEVIALLLANNANVNEISENGETVLHNALTNVKNADTPKELDLCKEIVIYLIENGADLNSKNANKKTALAKARELIPTVFSEAFINEMETRAKSYAEAHPEKNKNNKRPKC
jgi:ankyrin repeat protein